MRFLWINEIEKSKRSNMKNNFHVTLAERQMTIAETNAGKNVDVETWPFVLVNIFWFATV